MADDLYFGTPREQFSAARIWAAEEECPPKDRYVLFRRTFFTEDEGLYTLRLFADKFYDLYVDGHFLHRGPMRSHEAAAHFDELCYFFPKGDHTVAVLVHRLDKSMAGHRVGAAAFWMEIEDARGEIRWATDESWKALRCDAFAPSDYFFFSHADRSEDVDMRRFPAGWQKPGFDDTGWPAACVTGKAGDEGDVHRNYTLRPIPLFDYVREQGEVTGRGVYAETAPEEPYPKFAKKRVFDGGEKPDGTYAVISFACTLSGTPRVRYSGAKDGDVLTIGYDDMLDGAGLPRPFRMAAQIDRFTLPAGDGEVECVMPRGFRYLLVTLSGDGRVEGGDALREEFPSLEGRAFASGDGFFSRLYEQSTRTMRICTTDGFVDCVNRERVLWLGDAYVMFLGMLCGEPDDGMLLSTLYEHARGQMEDGALGGYNCSNERPDWLKMANYDMCWLHMLCDYLLYTGREEAVAPLKETARRLVRCLAANRNDRLIMDGQAGPMSMFWNWGYEEPEVESLKASALFIYTLERLQKIPFLSDVAEEELLRQIPKMKKACFDRFWDEERRLFHDDVTPEGEMLDLCTQEANLLAVAAGICPVDLEDELVARVTDPAVLDAVGTGMQPPESERHYRDKVVPCATMYGALYLVRTLFEREYDEAGIRMLREIWGDFDGEPTLPEMRRNGGAESSLTNCHGWSGGPGFLLPQRVLGLYPIREGWRETVFDPPETENVPSAKGQMTTPRGSIKAQWSRLDGAIRMYVSAPEGITVRVHRARREWIVQGEKTLYVPDQLA